jgi:hypothetical protein
MVMKKIYSKRDSDLLLHIIVSFEDFNESFLAITNPTEFLQSIGIRVNEGHKAEPHKHNIIPTYYVKKQQQEAWVILSGLIECTLYDIDDTPLGSYPISERGMLITLLGGHSLVVREDNTVILEFKCGPYLGQSKDKTFINN